jgi:hypothetical protein
MVRISKSIRMLLLIREKSPFSQFRQVGPPFHRFHRPVWHDFAEGRNPLAASLAEVRGFLGEFKFSVKIAVEFAEGPLVQMAAWSQQGVRAGGRLAICCTSKCCSRLHLRWE